MVSERTPHLPSLDGAPDHVRETLLGTWDANVARDFLAALGESPEAIRGARLVLGYMARSMQIATGVPDSPDTKVTAVRVTAETAGEVLVKLGAVISLMALALDSIGQLHE